MPQKFFRRAKTCPVSLKNHDVTARRKTHMACCGKYKALILKYVPYISKYMPYIFRFFRCLKHNDLQNPKIDLRKPVSEAPESGRKDIKNAAFPCGTRHNYWIFRYINMRRADSSSLFQ